MIYLLFDNPSDMGKVSFISQLIRCEVKEIYSPKSKLLIVGWLRGCMSTMNMSHRGDTIVCWYDFQAILCYWLCKFTFRYRKIVCINLLLKEKKTFKNKLVSWLYKKPLNSKFLLASVTSREYGEHLKKRLRIKKDFYLLHDVYHESYRWSKELDVIPNTVFCGGRNGRDWHFMIEVAKSMPNVEFHLVMPEGCFHELKGKFPINVIAKYNLSYNDFMKEMCASEIVALPLDTESPAGLIVLFQAIANMKYVITTDTMTTREYFPKDIGNLQLKIVDDWVRQIRYSLGNVVLQEMSSKYEYDYISQKCTQEEFVKGVFNMVIKLK